MQRKQKNLIINIITGVLALIFLIGLVFVSVNQIQITPRALYLLAAIFICMALALYFFHIEKNQYQSRELVLIALLSTLAVVGRMLFFFVPQVKPITAIVIFAGVYFGSQSGFLVGSMSMFLSNMLFGQGTHTLWQMYAMGLIGFLAGLFFSKKRHVLSVSIYGFFAVMLIYAPLMNLSSALFAIHEVNIQNLLPFFIAGLPWDIVHGVSTVIFLVLLYRPLDKKIKRIKLKYEIIGQSEIAN